MQLGKARAQRKTIGKYGVLQAAKTVGRILGSLRIILENLPTSEGDIIGVVSAAIEFADCVDA